MKITIVDYGSGNLRSAAKALARAAQDAGLDAEILVTADPDQVADADRVVLPGVGAFGDCWSGLRGLDGMTEALQSAVIEQGRPFLGICVGMQLMASRGLENGVHPGLDWVAGDVELMKPMPDKSEPGLKVPHMGWNELVPGRKEHPVLKNLPAGAHVYFVHSYHFVPKDRSTVLAETDYGGQIAAVVGRDNLVGTQFHPEKSQGVGLRLLTNFLTWTP